MYVNYSAVDSSERRCTHDVTHLTVTWRDVPVKYLAGEWLSI